MRLLATTLELCHVFPPHACHGSILTHFEFAVEFYWLERGAPISDPRTGFLFQNIILRRQSIKHVVEQRKAEGKSIEEIKQLFFGTLETIKNFDFEILNTNQADYPGSVMRVKTFEEWKRGVIVVLSDQNDISKRIFITSFPCREKRISLLQKKRL
jgi:hypothetical protein